MTKRYGDLDSSMAPIQHAVNITLSADPLAEPTRFVMVQADGTITGVLKGDSASHTTFTLKAGVLYPFAFKIISATTGTSVKGYF